jgi:hypothetical protein
MSAFVITPPEKLNDALDVIRYVASKRKSPTTIIVDAMERIKAAEEREKFAQLVFT